MLTLGCGGGLDTSVRLGTFSSDEFTVDTTLAALSKRPLPEEAVALCFCFFSVGAFPHLPSTFTLSASDAMNPQHVALLPN
eukprot:m.467238 g.467238  ORF g.467238 m.467238 type:complete len:81 (+) comp26071_c0_seq1:906-1148(+)